MKHHSKPHNDLHSMAVSANKVLKQYQKRIDENAERKFKSYEKQLSDGLKEQWLTTLAVSTQVFYEMTGNKQKTEKFAEKLDEKLRMYRELGTPTQAILDELERLTDISISLEE